jgi:alpha-mannosidase
VSCDAANVVLETLKKEECGERLVLRLYESQGCRGPVTIDFGFPVKKVWECNLVEDEDREITTSRDRIRTEVTPYEIRTFKLEVG